MRNRCWRIILSSFVILAAMSVAAPAQTYNVIASFDGINGAYPEYATLAQGRDGNFYGTLFYGCTNGSVCIVYKVTPQGKLTHFCAQLNCPDIIQPYGGLVLATDGNFYGTTAQGGTYTWGTVFKMTPAGAVTIVYSFCAIQPTCADGLFPLFGVIQGSNGKFYGTTPSAAVTGSQGTVFQLTAGGVLTTLHSFNGSDGSNPSGPLVQGSDGNFYGETLSGGLYGNGTIFKITASGKFATLHNFTGVDGSEPSLGLIQALDGNFYGTAQFGGANGGGTIFKMTPAGSLKTLYNFCNQPNCIDGNRPISPLVQATDGNFYGTSGGGGAWGTIFQVTPSGTLTTLHTLTGPPDGSTPQSGLLQSTNGTLYGATTWGGDGPVVNCGSLGCGAVYSLSMGLGPFVSFVQRAAKVGQTAQILGQGFTGTTQVSFNGISAAFTVKSSTFLTATVPTGATTGYVTVTTPTGTLTSNVPFRVTP